MSFLCLQIFKMLPLLNNVCNKHNLIKQLLSKSVSLCQDTFSTSIEHVRNPTTGMCEGKIHPNAIHLNRAAIQAQPCRTRPNKCTMHWKIILNLHYTLGTWCSFDGVEPFPSVLKWKETKFSMKHTWSNALTCKGFPHRWLSDVPDCKVISKLNFPFLCCLGCLIRLLIRYFVFMQMRLWWCVKLFQGYGVRALQY